MLALANGKSLADALDEYGLGSNLTFPKNSVIQAKIEIVTAACIAGGRGDSQA